MPSLYLDLPLLENRRFGKLVLVDPLGKRPERTYSAPLAAFAFAKETIEPRVPAHWPRSMIWTFT